MNVSRRLGSILGAAGAALVLCAGPAAAGGQPAASPVGAAAQLDQPSTITSAGPEAAGKCLDAYDWGRGPWVQMWGCHGGANQSWSVSWNSTSGGWNIRNEAGRTCVDGSPGHGEQLILNICGDGLGQSWKIDSFPGPARLESIAFPGQCADIANWGRSSVVMLWDCGSQANQYWLFG
ncbi:RICIN domain-containing protein [Kitasatospora purpeofusca]|uniref:RICIN domain-containing protein n=1 Tax=Kitasatospora purpeofusca TaxID=67352 RepID=UPI002A5A656F|nr:RICIN domain-containing protein [Kitasatospora purpeofusca]MDY0816388.1 RICIN domain-containing protein [Kitasatospora purpeofusca]